MAEREKVLDILGDVLQRSREELAAVGDDSDLREWGLDSITSIDLILGLENTYGITVEDEDLMIENFNTLKKLGRLVAKYNNEP